MNQLYQRTFDHVTMPEDHARSLRSALASHCSNNETEVIPMKKHLVRRSTSFLVAAILIAAMSVSALACGIYYYVTYEVHEGVELPEDAFDLTGQDADFELGSYDYHEEGDMIIVDFDQTAADEDVSYEITDDQVLAESGETVGLTGQDADFEVSPYSYTEENGKVIVDMSGADSD